MRLEIICVHKCTQWYPAGFYLAFCTAGRLWIRIRPIPCFVTKIWICTETIESVTHQKKREHASWEDSRQIKRTTNIMDSVFNVNHNSRHDMISSVYAKQGRSVELRLGRLPKGTRFHKILLTCCSFHSSHVHLLTGFLQRWMVAKCAYSLQGLRTSQKVWFILTSYCMYKEWGIKLQPLHCELQWSSVLPRLMNPLLVPHLEWRVWLCIWWRHSSHLVPWRTGPGDESYMGYSLTITQDMCGWFVFF
jgi:hypothetical protein